MAYKLDTISTNKGVPYWPLGTNVRARRLKGNAPDMSAAGVMGVVSSPERMGVGTGRVLVSSDKLHWYELETPFGKGFVRNDLLTPTAPTATVRTGDGQGLVLNMLRRDNRICRELLYQDALMRRLSAQGASVANAHVATHKALRKRFVERRTKLLNDTRIKAAVAPEPGFEALTARANAGVAGIGIAPLVWGAVALGIVLVAGITYYAVYQTYHTDAKATELDLKETRALTAVLENVSAPARKAVLAEVQAQMTKAYGEGYTKAATEADAGFFGGVKDLLKWGGLLWAATKFLG